LWHAPPLHTHSTLLPCLAPTRTHPPTPNRYADAMEQLPTGRRISPNPKDWRCDETGVTENLWLNLGTGHIGSGRAVGVRAGVGCMRCLGGSRGGAGGYFLPPGAVSAVLLAASQVQVLRVD